MTEHRKIPVAGAKPAGKSLFERAENLFEGDPFKAAPVPKTLARPVNRRPEPGKSLQQRDATVSSETFAPAEKVEKLAPAASVRVDFGEEQHHVDRELLVSNGLINPDGPVTALLEEFRIVKRQLLKSVRSGDSDKSRRILVCSPLPGEGKTFCSANLALAMAAEKDCQVVLVDADFAKPSMLSLLGLPKGPGLMDALANSSIEVEDCVIPTDIDGLFVLPAGHQTNSDSEFLASKRTEQVLDRLTRGAPERILIFDSPPALAASPAADLANHVGQALVVTRADKTGQSALEDALTLLSNCRDIKLLLNDASFSPSGRRFGAYYGYGS